MSTTHTHTHGKLSFSYSPSDISHLLCSYSFSALKRIPGNENEPLPHPRCRLLPHAPGEDYLCKAAHEGFFPSHMIQDAGGESLEQTWAQNRLR